MALVIAGFLDYLPPNGVIVLLGIKAAGLILTIILGLKEHGRRNNSDKHGHDRVGSERKRNNRR